MLRYQCEMLFSNNNDHISCLLIYLGYLFHYCFRIDFWLTQDDPVCDFEPHKCTILAYTLHRSMVLRENLGTEHTNQVTCLLVTGVDLFKFGSQRVLLSNLTPG